MNALPAILAVSLLAAALSGCIAYSEDEPDATSYTTQEEAAAPPPKNPLRDGAPATDILHTASWTGQGGPDETFEVPRDYDFLQVALSHSGQFIGQTTTTDGNGDEYDEGVARSQNGVFTFVRTLQGAAGSGQVTTSGIMSGSGSLSVIAYDNVPLPSLMSMTWSGQSTNPVVLDAQYRFFVPEGFTELVLLLASGGYSAPGITVHDPEGNEQASIGGTGSDTASATVSATPGLWTVSLQGIAYGGFSITALGLTTEPGTPPEA